MFWVIQVVIISFVIIFILHNLYTFFKETLTVPKMKDLVRRPQQKYETLFREMQHQNVQHGDAKPGSENDAMKNELKRYLMELNSSSLEPESSSSITNSSFIELGSAYQ